MSLRDDVVSLIDEKGPLTVDQVWSEFGGERRVISNCINRSMREGSIRPCGLVPPSGPGQRVKLYETTDGKPNPPGWLPIPLPANSVWDYARKTT